MEIFVFLKKPSEKRGKLAICLQHKLFSYREPRIRARKAIYSHDRDDVYSQIAGNPHYQRLSQIHLQQIGHLVWFCREIPWYPVLGIILGGGRLTSLSATLVLLHFSCGKTLPGGLATRSSQNTREVFANTITEEPLHKKSRAVLLIDYLSSSKFGHRK